MQGVLGTGGVMYRGVRCKGCEVQGVLGTGGVRYRGCEVQGC